MSLIDLVEQESKRSHADLGQFNVGDTVDVHTRIKEGDKERIQMGFHVCTHCHFMELRTC